MPSTPVPLATVYLYEDDSSLAFEIVMAFTEAGLDIERLNSQEALRDRAHLGGNHVLIMDRLVDEYDSLDLLAKVRARGDRIPVVVISSLSSTGERIRGLKAGGDDYLVKPFAMAELIARVEALHRRATRERATHLIVGDLEMHLIARTVRRGAREIHLQPREFGLLEYLMRHAGQVVTRAMLLEDVWNYRAPVPTNLVDVHVGKLRRKIEVDDEARLIVSVRGLGFKLIDDGLAPS